MVVTHAHADAVNRYLQTTLGREKLYRFIQYFSRFYAFYLFRNDAPKETVQRWVNLKTHIGNARKFYRLLKPIEFAQGAVKGLAIQDEIIRATTVTKQVAMFIYYITEVFVLTNSINVYKAANLKQIVDFGQKCWLTAITVSFISGLYNLKKIAVREHMLEKTRKALVNNAEKSSSQIADLKAEEKAVAKQKYTVKYGLVADAFDFLIPSSNLGLINSDDGIVGLAGMVTSFMGMNTQWTKLNG